MVSASLRSYPRRAPLQRDPSEFGATKSCMGSPMACLHRAVLMIRKLNLLGFLETLEMLTFATTTRYVQRRLDLAGLGTSGKWSSEAGIPMIISTKSRRSTLLENNNLSISSNRRKRSEIKISKRGTKQDKVNKKADAGTVQRIPKDHSKQIKKWHFHTQSYATTTSILQ